jgi:arsenate reductase
MSALFVCYPKCTTCQKAGKWLDGHNVAYTFRDIKLHNPGADELRGWIAQSGLEPKRFFNTSGLLYRSMALADKLPSMSADEMIALLATDGMLVKRPLLVTGDKVLVGFKETDWEQALL